MMMKREEETERRRLANPFVALPDGFFPRR